MTDSEFNRYCEALLIQYNRRNTASTKTSFRGNCPSIE